jgi:hypothetical protein
MRQDADALTRFRIVPTIRAILNAPAPRANRPGIGDPTSLFRF